MSAPAQKWPPAPVRITSRTSRSSDSRRKMSCSSRHRKAHGVAPRGPVQGHHGDRVRPGPNEEVRHAAPSPSAAGTHAGRTVALPGPGIQAHRRQKDPRRQAEARVGRRQSHLPKAALSTRPGAGAVLGPPRDSRCLACPDSVPPRDHPLRNDQSGSGLAVRPGAEPPCPGPPDGGEPVSSGARPFFPWVDPRPRPAPAPNHSKGTIGGWLGAGAGRCELIEERATARAAARRRTRRGRAPCRIRSRGAGSRAERPCRGTTMRARGQAAPRR
jgi:hypothetical protein